VSLLVLQKGLINLYNDYNTKEVILKDINKNGKDNNWKGRKEDNLNLAQSYKRLGFKKYYRVADCSTFLEFRYFLDTGEKKLNRANFCKVRLCPMCSWRRSLKIFGQVSKVMDYVEEKYNYKYIFLTLTVKNCFGEDLKSTLDHMTDSFNRMTRRKAFKQSIKGYFRSLEITYNKECNTYHPHFHLLLAVNKSYFKDTKIYLTQEDWTDLWKSSLRVEYTPIVDVRRLRENKGKEVAEVAKYTVKSEDFIIKDEEHGTINKKLTDEVVKTLDLALHRKRLVSFGFIFKKVHKKLNLDDPEDANLVNTDNDENLRNDLMSVILRYQWNFGIKNYKLVQIVEDKEK
jgi:plasmid rolling circle replication initiator protein Rep